MNDATNEKEKKKINPVAAAVTGAVVGAGVAAAGAAVLQDAKNRQKVKKVLGTIRDRAVSYMEKQTQKTKNRAGEILPKKDNKKMEAGAKK